jgi:nuclear pore complex protein Nup155
MLAAMNADEQAENSTIVYRNGQQKSDIITRSLQCEDQIFHEMLYTQFIAEGHIDYLLQIETPFLEPFLLSDPTDLAKREILWKYHLRHNRFMKAAMLLYEMATSDAHDFELKQRIECLTRAVSVSKSSTEYGRDQQDLDAINDMYDVALVQWDIYNALIDMRQENDLSDLNYHLFDLQELYQRFAQPYELDEITLSIFYISDQGNAGRRMAEQLLDTIIRKCHDAAVESGRSPFDALADKMRVLG